MKLSLIIIMFSLLLPLEALALQDHEVIFDKLLSIDRIDNDVYTEHSNRKKKVFWNGVPIDSTGVSFGAKKPFRDWITCHKRKGSRHLFYRIDDKRKIKYLGHIDSCAVFSTKYNFFAAPYEYGEQDGVKSLLIGRIFAMVDLETGTMGDEVKLDSIFGYDSLDAREICSLYEMPNGDLIITFCVCTGECLNHEYYRLSTARPIIVLEKLEFKEPDTDTYKVNFVDSDDQSILINHLGSSEKGNDGYFIHDLKLKEISPALKRQSKNCGGNYRAGKLISQNVFSNLDDGREVIIRYKFSLPIERSLYRIYSSQNLIENDLREVGKPELDLLKNMVYARHNIQFQNLFYQAYFNYYEFYWERQFSAFANQRKPRLDNVDLLLTEVDKSNLARITSFAEKLKP